MSAAAIRTRLGEAELLIGAFERLGLSVVKIETNIGERPNADWIWSDVRLYLDTLTGEDCEAAAVTLLNAYPDAWLERLGGGQFAVTCHGRPSWSVYFYNSVCEKVQVGTIVKTVPAPGAPTIEVEEPVYEWRCADPILAAQRDLAVAP